MIYNPVIRQIAGQDPDKQDIEFQIVNQNSDNPNTSEQVLYPSFWKLTKDIFSTDKWTLLTRFVKYVTIVRIFLPHPDMLMCFMGFYFVANPPEYINLEGKEIICTVCGIFKLLSLIIFFLIGWKIVKVKEQENIKNNFCIELIDKLKGSDTYMEIVILLTYLNMLWDIYIFVCFKCYGSNCYSVTQNNSPKNVLTTKILRKILEVHILNSMVISNFMHIVFTPIVVYYQIFQNLPIMTF
jgi:hypothetical protein